MSPGLGGSADKSDWGFVGHRFCGGLLRVNVFDVGF
jgi:hypothetical protein